MNADQATVDYLKGYALNPLEVPQIEPLKKVGESTTPVSDSTEPVE